MPSLPGNGLLLRVPHVSSPSRAASSQTSRERADDDLVILQDAVLKCSVLPASNSRLDQDHRLCLRQFLRDDAQQRAAGDE